MTGDYDSIFIPFDIDLSPVVDAGKCRKRVCIDHRETYM